MASASAPAGGASRLPGLQRGFSRRENRRPPRRRRLDLGQLAQGPIGGAIVVNVEAGVVGRGARQHRVIEILRIALSWLHRTPPGGADRPPPGPPPRCQSARGTPATRRPPTTGRATATPRRSPATPNSA